MEWKRVFRDTCRVSGVQRTQQMQNTKCLRADTIYGQYRLGGKNKSDFLDYSSSENVHHWWTRTGRTEVIHPRLAPSIRTAGRRPQRWGRTLRRPAQMTPFAPPRPRHPPLPAEGSSCSSPPLHLSICILKSSKPPCTPLKLQYYTPL